MVIYSTGKRKVMAWSISCLPGLVFPGLFPVPGKAKWFSQLLRDPKFSTTAGIWANPYGGLAFCAQIEGEVFPLDILP